MRDKLDELLKAADAALKARDAIESCCSPEWAAAHRTASALYQAVMTERRRLWKLARWGSWMSLHDRQLATISGEI